MQGVKRHLGNETLAIQRFSGRLCILMVFALTIFQPTIVVATDIAVELIGQPSDGIVSVGEQASVTMRLRNLGPDVVPLVILASNEVDGPGFPLPTNQCLIVVGQINPPISPISYTFSWRERDVPVGSVLECEVRFTILRMPGGQIPITVRYGNPGVGDDPGNNHAEFVFRQRGVAAAVPVPINGVGAVLILQAFLMLLSVAYLNQRGSRP
jgi:hypothetical protein